MEPTRPPKKGAQVKKIKFELFIDSEVTLVVNIDGEEASYVGTFTKVEDKYQTVSEEGNSPEVTTSQIVSISYI